MDYLIKLLQLVLAFVFASAGMFKIALPPQELARRLGSWVEHRSSMSIKAIGLVEVIAGIGILLPGTMSIPAAFMIVPASTMIVTMVCALWVHARNHEPFRMFASLVVASAATVVMVALV